MAWFENVDLDALATADPAAVLTNPAWWKAFHDWAHEEHSEHADSARVLHDLRDLAGTTGPAMSGEDLHLALAPFMAWPDGAHAVTLAAAATFPESGELIGNDLGAALERQLTEADHAEVGEFCGAVTESSDQLLQSPHIMDYFLAQCATQRHSPGVDAPETSPAATAGRSQLEEKVINILLEHLGDEQDAYREILNTHYDLREKILTIVATLYKQKSASNSR